MKIQQIKYTFIQSYLMYLAGLFIGILTPGRLGDFVKIIYMKTDGYSAIKATFCSFLDRIADLLFLVLSGFFCLFWLGKLVELKNVLFLTICIFFISIGVMWKLMHTEKFLNLIIKIFPGRYYALFDKGFKELKSYLKNHTLTDITILIGITVISWILYFTVIFLLANSISLSLDFIDTTVLFILSTLVTFIPVTIAGIGTRDVSLIFIFTQLNYVKEDAVSFSLLILISYLLTATFGCIAWMIKPVKA